MEELMVEQVEVEADRPEQKFQVLTAIQGHGLEQYIDSDIEPPSRFIQNGDGVTSSTTQQPNPEYFHWIKQDKLISLWLLGSMSEEILSQMLDCRMVKEIWTLLECTFASRNLARVMQLKSKLENMKKGSMNLKNYFLKIKNLVDSLATAGKRLPTDDHIMHILARLGPEFDSIVSVISTRKSPQSIQEPSSNGFSHGFPPQVQSSTGFSSSSTPAQSNFGVFGGSTPQMQAMMVANDFNRDVTWYPDSGATNHVTNDFGNFSLGSKYHGNGKIQVGNGTNLSISHIGSALLQSISASNSSQPVFHLQNLLHVPQIAKNLISLSLFAKDNHVFFEFHPSNYFVKDLTTGQLLFQGTVHDELYQFELRKASSQKPFSVSSTSNNSPTIFNSILQYSNSPMLHAPITCNTSVLDIWHRRFGHSFFLPIVQTVMRSCNKTSTLCHVYAIGKAHNLPFPTSQTVYTTPLQLVVADLWGSAYVSSQNGFRYFLSFVDSYSHHTWIYFLHNKSEAFQAFLLFKSLVEKSLNCSIIRLQTDGGGEFRSFVPFLRTHGIEHRLSCPYTSQQNGIVERKHRQIVDIGLTLLSQASIPLVFCDDALFSTVAYLINRLPTTALHGLSLFEKLFSRRPDYSFLKPSISSSISVLPFSLPPSCVGVPSDLPPLHSTSHVVASPTTTSSPLVVSSLSNGLSSPLAPSAPTSSPIDPTLTPSSPVIVPPTNTHPMVTRYKNGISEPKAFFTNYLEIEPPLVKAALQCLYWVKAMNEEYDALLRNKTWSLVPQPQDKKIVSPMVKPITIRVLLTLALAHGWSLRQLDVNRFLLEEVLMTQPPDLVVRGSQIPLVCKLHKAICMVITESSQSEIDNLVAALHTKFSLKDLGVINYFLGIEVSHPFMGGLFLSQSKYISYLLHKTTMHVSNPIATPMISGTVLSAFKGEPFSDPHLFRSTVGTLQYVTITRSELAYSVNKGTFAHGLYLRKPVDFTLQGFIDSDWASDPDDRRSTSGFCVYLGVSRNCELTNEASTFYHTVIQLPDIERWGPDLVTEQNLVDFGLALPHNPPEMLRRSASLYEREHRRDARSLEAGSGRASDIEGLDDSSSWSDFGLSNPHHSISTWLSDLHQIFNRLVVFSGWVADEINHLRCHYTPREKLEQAISSLNQANSLLEGTQRKLEMEKRKSRDELANLQRRLDEVNARLFNSEFLAREFKKTQEYVDLQNSAMECGVFWFLRQVSTQHPDIDISFLPERFRAERDAPNDMDDDDDE
ncbi:uncharacterized protein LOC111023586 [Momordica charantia]|uniref:Uncharacterized protein LOC111023586 n=1 Tax=Momordica charantia TaxID=3673 RepID=A0A6J1DSS1_MOMCH|nr:uncharacterized protein LOC111023586 [Momordica charantia]